MKARAVATLVLCALSLALPSPAKPKTAPTPTATSSDRQCFFARSRRIAELTTRSRHHVELYDEQIAIDGHFDNRCTGLPGSHPLAIARWGDGFAVAFRDEPLTQWSAGEYRPLAGSIKAHARALASDAEHLYVGSDHGAWTVHPDGTVEPLAAAQLAALAITALYVKPDHSVLVGTDTKGLWHVSTDGRDVENLAPKAIVGCIRSRGGSIQVQPPGPSCRDHATAGTLPSDHVTALAAYQGDVVVGTFDGGVFTIDAKGNPHALPGAPRNVNALLAVGTRLYIGAASGLYVAEAGRVTRIALDKPEPHVNDLVLAHDGAIWLATNRGAMRWVDGSIRVFSTERGLPSPLTYAIAEAPDGAIWAGTARGLVRLHARSADLFSTANGKLPHDWVTALSPDGDAMLVGTYNAGVVRIDASGRSSPVPAFDKAWVNPHGIARIHGAVSVVTEGGGLASDARASSDRLPSLDVTAVLDNAGVLWVGTRAGLLRTK